MKIAVYTDDGIFYESMEAVLNNLGNDPEIPFKLIMLRNLKQMTEVLSVSDLNMALIDLGTPKGKEAAEFLYLNDSGCSCYLLDKDETHGLFGYQVRARDFLIKPVEKGKLLKIVSEEVKRQRENLVKEIKVKVEGLWKAIVPASILYVESMGHSLIFHMVSGRDIKFVATFKEYYPILNMFPRFLRCHQSYILNLDYVSDMKSDVFLLGSGEEINISRQYRRECRQYYIEYMMKKYYENT